VDDDPLALAADADRDRLHPGAAVGCPIAGSAVDVTAPQACRAVVAVRCAGSVGRDVEPAVDAPKRT
jgi:hypothetical protein